MAYLLHTEIEIEATSSRIWEILTDFENYPTWNPFIQSLNGNVKVGHTIEIHLTPPDAKVMTFKPKILVFEKEKELRWLGKLLMPGLFDGEHIFKLRDNGNGTTTFIQQEKFKGLLVPLLKKQLENNTKNGFMRMNEALKELAEQ